jgi:Na+-transporting methylmalonyl-CoA/oxaloacetate decarboxylase gamma subunit
MFQLYKKRDFSTYINDSFGFFKQLGKNYFTNYFKITGGFMVVLVALIYIIFKLYFEFVFAAVNNAQNPSSNFSTVLNDNIILFLGLGILFIFLLVLVSIIQFSFPVVYMTVYEKNGENPTATAIVKELKAKPGKIFKFFIGFVFIVFPLTLISFFIMILLCFIIIGFPLLFIAFPLLTSWINISLYHYLHTNDRYFASLSKSFSYIKSSFWPIIGSTLIVYFIIHTITTILTLIPYFIGIIYFFTSVVSDDSTGTPELGFMSILLPVILAFSIVLNYILNNLSLVNHGLIYFSCREQTENKSLQSEIETIGIHFE